MGQLFDLLTFLRTQMICSCLRFPRVKLWASAWTSQENKLGFVWTSQDPNPKPFGSCLNLSRLRTETVGQLFQLPKNKMLSRCLNFPRLTCCATVWASQDHKCWAVVWTSQGPNLKLFGSCLKLSSLRTETVDQLFELPKNTNVGQLFELPKTQIHLVGLFFLFLATKD